MIDAHDAACCLLTAAAAVVAADDPNNPGNPLFPPYQHAYLSAAGTWPYCPHDAIVARDTLPTREGPDPAADYRDDQGRVTVWHDRFDLWVLRTAPPWPDIANQPQCLNDLYGDCASTDASTISGHHRIIAGERRLLRRSLIEAWCDCMANASPARPKSSAAWIESMETINEGRFAGTLFTVAALLS